MPLTMTEAEKAYLAGIIDGEGCISLGLRLEKYVTPTVQVTNTSRVLIDWLHQIGGGNVYQRKDHRPTRKPSWLWSVAGQKALDIVRTARPYLRVKGEQADIVLDLPRFRRGVTGRDVLGRVMGTMTAQDFADNDARVARIRILNQRGVACL